MKISKTHQLFAVKLGKPKALENPQDFLGQNHLAVINFWLYLDTLNQDQWKIVSERYSAAGYASRSAARDAAESAAGSAAGPWRGAPAAWSAAGSAAGDAAGYAAGYAAWYAAGYATWEIIGSHILLEQGKELFFVPMFDNL